MPTTTEAHTPDTEIVLTNGDLHLRISPFGASLRGLWQSDRGGKIREIVTGYSGAKSKVGGQGDVLIPFPGRVRDGQYTFEGRAYQMDRNDKDGPNAIHGFLRLKLWEIESEAEDSIALRTSLDAGDAAGYPFSLEASVRYDLLSDGLACHFIIENTGETAAPVAAGFHPYFSVGTDTIDNAVLTVPMEATLAFENLLPTGEIVPVAGTTFDFRKPRPIGDTKFNTCFLQPMRDADGLVQIELASGDNARAVTVWMDDAFDYVVLYSGDPLPETHRRRSLAIEPMTCASDGFNHPEWGLVALKPGDTFRGTWGVTVRL